jgi:hypothetical protein
MASSGDGREVSEGGCLTCVRYSVECSYDIPSKVHDSEYTPLKYTAHACADETNKRVRVRSRLDLHTQDPLFPQICEIIGIPFG